MTLQTQRLVVRDPLACDLPGWHRLFSGKSNMRFVEHLQCQSLEESRETLQRAIDAANRAPRVKCFFTIELVQSGEFIGSIGFMTEQMNYGLQGNVGWFLLPEYQGKGYATEAFAALIPCMFTEWCVDCINAGCNVANPASERVMQKGGLSLTKRQGDRLQYQLMKTDWEKNM